MRIELGQIVGQLITSDDVGSCDNDRVQFHQRVLEGILLLSKAIIECKSMIDYIL